MAWEYGTRNPTRSHIILIDQLEAGKLSFDYQLRSGIVTTSNGLELMKSVGLDV